MLSSCPSLRLHPSSTTDKDKSPVLFYKLRCSFHLDSTVRRIERAVGKTKDWVYLVTTFGEAPHNKHALSNNQFMQCV